MKKSFNILTSFVVIATLVLGNTSVAIAASASNASDNMTRQKISEASSHLIVFTLPTALASAGTITVTFPAAFTGTAATASTNWTAPSANVVLYTATAAQAINTVYTATVTGLINPATAGNQLITISATNGDTGEITVPIINDDQIKITAKVAQVLFFNVRDGISGTATDNAVQFGTLTSGAARYATDAGSGATSPAASSEIEAGTNATNGYVIDVTGETLVSMDGTGNDINGLFTPAVSAPGSEQFGINVSKTQTSTGTTQGVVAADYATNYHLPTSATTEILATNAGPASNEIYDVTYLANISSLTPAGNYTTAMTYTMTAQF